MYSYKSFKLNVVARGGSDKSLKECAADLEQLMSCGETLKVDSAARVIKICIDEQNLIVKRYTARGLWHVIKRALRQTRAKNAWRASIAFADAGINVPEPVLYWEHKFGPLKADSFFVYRAVEGGSLLESLPLLSGEQRVSVMDQLGDLFDRLRSKQLTHGDMKATNLMLVDGKVLVFDLDVAGQRTYFFNRGHRRDQKRFLRNWQSNKLLCQELAGRIGFIPDTGVVALALGR